MVNRALALVCTLSVVPLAAGCGTTSRPLVRSFSGVGVSFAYPATWHAHSYAVPSNFSTWIVSLSPQTLHRPCTTRHGTNNTTITCHQAIDHLQPDSVLTNWSTHTWLGWSFRRAQGTPLRVGGRAAKLDVMHDSCGIGADEMIDVVIAIPGRAEGDSWYELDACIRGPDTSKSEREVRQLLRTVRFTP
jgi:hypothetical protein